MTYSVLCWPDPDKDEEYRLFWIGDKFVRLYNHPNVINHFRRLNREKKLLRKNIRNFNECARTDGFLNIQDAALKSEDPIFAKMLKTYNTQKRRCHFLANVKMIWI